METEDKIKVMQAYLAGKKIEFKKCSSDDWAPVKSNLNWNWIDYDYRITPEPTYRPYRCMAEFQDAIKEHGPCIHLADYEQPYMDVIPVQIFAHSDSFSIFSPSGELKNVTYNDLLAKGKWQDFTKCGIVIEDDPN